MAVAEMQRWEIYLERRVQAKGWDGQLLRRAQRRLPRSVPQAHIWFLLEVHLNAPIASARLAAARVVDEPLQCCPCSCNLDSLDYLPRCQTVLDVYDSIRVVASLFPMSDGRPSLLQERWEGNVVARIVAFYAAIWNVRPKCRRGVRFHSFAELRDLVLMGLQCPWLVRSCPTRSTRLCQPQRLQSTGLTGPAEVKAQMQKLTRAGAPLCSWLMIVVLVLA